jgi:flagellar basal body-associated protein FliL
VAIGDSILFKSDVDLVLRRISLVVLAALAVLAIVVVVLWFGRSGENPSSSMTIPGGPLRTSAASALGILGLASRMVER